MHHLLAVGCGGFIGAVMRYGALTWIPRTPYFPDHHFPLATLLVNLSGCLAIGLLKGAMDSFHWMSGPTSLFIFTGILGSFTTFSTFGFETWELVERGRMGEAFLYVGLSVVAGIALVLVGYWLGGRFVPQMPA